VPGLIRLIDSLTSLANLFENYWNSRTDSSSATPQNAFFSTFIGCSPFSSLSPIIWSIYLAYILSISEFIIGIVFGVISPKIMSFSLSIKGFFSSRSSAGD
jgi:hypothetical protein